MGQASILNIPRDTYTNIPGHGTDKINAAHAYGGPQLVAAAVSELVGVDIPYVIATGFVGSTAMVNEMGGVDVDVPTAMSDANSGAFFGAGVQHFGGDEALAFSRNRGISGGDFTRTHNQGRLILAALAKLRAEGPTPARILRSLAVLLRHTTLDGVSLTDLYRLGRLGLSIDPANVTNITMPGVAGQAGSASVVFPTAAAPTASSPTCATTASSPPRTGRQVGRSVPVRPVILVGTESPPTPSVLVGPSLRRHRRSRPRTPGS